MYLPVERMVPDLSSIVKDTAFSSHNQFLQRNTAFGKQLVEIVHITIYYQEDMDLRLVMHTIMIVDGFLRDLGLQSITGIRQFRKDVVTH